ncbi:glycosyl hydrolase family 38 protein [Nitzschia inconspicua]|uniref:Glycosyl hydrolase family 38 protein n=1 Tax=Nitzschia inconspicua TaxID=303405 RepID=A0A9K3LAR0_9STRA|nr:glycosyl hydrolase family 38 protein [Nitzschia inconspicua]
MSSEMRSRQLSLKINRRSSSAGTSNNEGVISHMPIPELSDGRLSVMVSPKDKEAFNARLSDRRKQRREQRLRRAKRLQNSASGGYGAKHLVVFGTAFCIVFSAWMIGFYWFADFEMNDTNGNAGTIVKGAASPLQVLKDRGHFLRNIKAALSSSTSGNPKLLSPLKSANNNAPGAVQPSPIIKGNPNEVVDMRIMNQELPFANPNGGKWTQGWDVQPIEVDPKRPLQIFVVPHSHCDPGWIKTFDDYFQSQTKQILTSVIQALQKQPERKFIWAEISYFEWWWREQTDSTQRSVKELLKNGQFEFVTGGWVQPDEANTQLYAMEIQLQEGHDFIRKIFGEEYIPKFGWSIDPFGYSPTMAYLLKKYDFQAMLIQRVHYAIKKELAMHKQLEFMWRQTWDSSGDYDIFTHVMPFYSYDVPHTCGPDPSICCQFDFARMSGKIAQYVGTCPWGKQPQKIHDHNVKERSLLLLDQYRKKAALYRSNVVIAPLGDDFRYRTLEEADSQYENYQRIFDYINHNVPNVQIQFGTLSDYFKTVLEDRPFSPPLLKGSFFTYSDREEDYWSGYFTSRVFDKALDRKLERVLYAATSMGADKLEMQGPRRALSLFQHHDGVTGTAKDYVVEDYAKRIHDAIGYVQKWMLKHMFKTTDSLQKAKEWNVHACWQSNAPRGLSQNTCEPLSGDSSGVQVILYNPLETEQSCGSTVVPGRTKQIGTLPCDVPGTQEGSTTVIKFDSATGLMYEPIREEWMVWKVKEGGAYLFFPGTLVEYPEYDVDIQQGGYIVSSKDWKRTVVERKSPSGASVIDFIYETNLQNGNEEWFARFTAPDIHNKGVFHTDLNGYNFDTHHYRSDMPIQSQVFPMPTHASIEDQNKRMTILSEHAQGTASLEEGSIDVWLDRRLNQDDARGLNQGIRDNVPTRTRLRLVLETQGYDAISPEFQITPFCKQQWKELNHPLEMFGTSSSKHLDSLELDNDKKVSTARKKNKANARIVTGLGSVKNRIPAVFMVYKRADYFKEVIESLLSSDYPRDTLPIIISHDGHVEEMVSYVETIKSKFRVIQLFHPHSCSEHPFTFPGDDPKLNEGYQGDTYGNKREGKVTCCKHHFTWMLNTVFGLEETKDADGFLFLEEDYKVAPTIYETIQNGFSYIDEENLQEKYFGITLDPTEGYAYKAPALEGSSWREKRFVTGPMAIRRDMFYRIKANAKVYCNWDDYNWDWSIVRLMQDHLLPYQILVPKVLQVAHIGLEGGLHTDAISEQKMEMMKFYRNNLPEFHDKVYRPYAGTQNALMHEQKGFGGWGHPADREHCMKLFGYS